MKNPHRNPEAPVEERRLNLMLVARAAGGHALDEVLTQDVHSLLGAELAAGSFPLGFLAEPTLYPLSGLISFPREAEHNG